jgi:hypothetical protein
MSSVLTSRSVAFGEAAAVVLDESLKSSWKLCALVTYYPDKIPVLAAGWPSDHNVTVHLTSSEDMMPSCRHYMYADVQPGFAEENLDMYDKVAAGLAWSRTLAVLRKGFGIEVDLEKIWDHHAEREFATPSRRAASCTDQHFGDSRVC